ncbi:MAG: hypothetical protein NC489_31540 [Ruminococcus flavefaciens]|nr:hypothetical protein [Ruminococcus flavefaciens]
MADLSADLDIPAHPWAFPHLTNDFACQLVFMATAVVLFCDAPFENEAAMYFKHRAGHTGWAMGHALYILAISFLFVLLLQVISILALIPQLDIRDGWGKIWGALGKSGIGRQYGVVFTASDYLVGKYTPLEATVYSFLLEWACTAWLGLLSYAGNMLSRKPVGTFLAAAFVLLDVTIYNEWTPAAYAFSPVTLAQLSAFAGKNLSYGITLAYAVHFFCVSIFVLLCICVWGHKLKHVASRISCKLRTTDRFGGSTSE